MLYYMEDQHRQHHQCLMNHHYQQRQHHHRHQHQLDLIHHQDYLVMVQDLLSLLLYFLILHLARQLHHYQIHQVDLRVMGCFLIHHRHLVLL